MRNESSISVFLVAPTLVRWGLERLLTAAGAPISLSGSAASTEEATVEIESQFPDVVVVDADSCSPADIEALYERTPVKIVAIGSSGDAEPRTHGVQAWVEKRATPASFVKTVVSTADGSAQAQPVIEVPVDHTVRQPEPEGQDPVADTLTPKQLQVLRAIASHPSAPAKIVADKLHISEHTLRNHLSEIYSRLGVTGRMHLQAVLASKPWLLGTA